MNQNFNIHDISWTRDLATRFWDYHSTHGSDHGYFSYQRGDALIRLARRKTNRLSSCHVLDFGCGPGILLEKLTKLGITCTGCDFSPASIERTKNRTSFKPTFQDAILLSGLPSELPAQSFDFVFLIETIEHLLDNDLDGTISEISRVLKPSGYLMVTTPNDEDLEAAKVFCPESGAIFHRKQHVRSWTEDSLSKFLQRFGFTKTYCKATFLAEPTWASLLRGAGLRLLRMKLPHLVYIGKKTGSKNVLLRNSNA